jgi:hypothetical protein
MKFINTKKGLNYALVMLVLCLVSCKKSDKVFEDEAIESSANLSIILKGKANNDLLTDVQVNVYAKPRGQEEFKLIYSGQTDDNGTVSIENVPVPNIVKVEMADTKYPAGDPVTAKVLGQKSAKISLDVNTIWQPDFLQDRSRWEVIAYSSYHVNISSPAANLPGNVLLNNTAIWHSNYAAPATPFPHWIVIDTKEERTMHGFGLKQRPANNGPVKGLEFYVSSDNKNWEKVIETEIELTNPGVWHVIKLAKPAKGRYIKFSAVSSHLVGTQFINMEQIGAY